MYKEMPLGESVLLRLDLDMLRKNGQKPANETFTNHLGTFYERRVSNFTIAGWFDKYVSQGEYQTTCTLGTNCSLGNKDYGRPFFTMILVKTDSQKGQERKSSGENHSYFRNMLGDFLTSLNPFGVSTNKQNPPLTTTHHENGMVSTQFSEGNKVVGTIQFNKKEESNYQKAQRAVIAQLKKDLPAMMEVWNYDAFEVLSSEEMLEMSVEREVAYAGTRILLFHKKKSDVATAEIENHSTKQTEIVHGENQKIVELD